jgi:hypothetical protein
VVTLLHSSSFVPKHSGNRSRKESGKVRGEERRKRNRMGRVIIEELVE